LTSAVADYGSHQLQLRRDIGSKYIQTESLIRTSK
jgi:hypothetical protein